MFPRILIQFSRWFVSGSITTLRAEEEMGDDDLSIFEKEPCLSRLPLA